MADNNEEYLDELLKSAMGQNSYDEGGNDDIASLLNHFSGAEDNSFIDDNNDFILDDSDVSYESEKPEAEPETGVEDNEIYNESASDNSKKSKKKKNKQKKLKEKKKFSIKNFFLDYEEEEKDTDENAKLIEKLYQDKDSLDKEVITEPDKKKKKEKKKKEPKPKKAKPVKQKKEKNPQNKIKIDGHVLIPGILVAVVITIALVVGNNFFSYNRNIKSASSNFEDGKYSKAYEDISGLKLKEKDEELYEQIFVMATLTQGLDAYENYRNAGDLWNALNSLICAVGRKNSNEDLIRLYGLENEASAIYGRILSILDKYGIDEEKALKLYSIKNYTEYDMILKGYGEDF